MIWQNQLSSGDRLFIFLSLYVQKRKNRTPIFLVLAGEITKKISAFKCTRVELYPKKIILLIKKNNLSDRIKIHLTVLF